MLKSGMDKRRAKFIPALGVRWLTPLYDPALRLLMRESIFKRHLMKQARIERTHRVLDLGCGTATLTVMIKQSHPLADVVGLDVDPDVLRRGQGKTAKAGVDIAFVLGAAFSLPFRDGSLDRVVSSLVFHHLRTEDKMVAFSETFRALRPGGELHMADFGKPHNRRMRLIASIMGRFEKTPDNIAGRLPQMMSDAGFEGVIETARYSTLFGTLSLYRGRKP